jgi:hypothetical protein
MDVQVAHLLQARLAQLQKEKMRKKRKKKTKKKKFGQSNSFKFHRVSHSCWRELEE